VISVNGEASEVAPGTTVGELLRALDAPDRGVAVALDGEVVPRGAWERTAIGDGTRIEVVMAVQGG
jgi:sulfur carrier protein